MSGNRWNRRGVPHLGWVLVDCIDLEEPSHTCEMCGNENVRYVHEVSHSQYTDHLRVGVICAGKMTGEGEAAASAEKLVRNAARRKLEARKREAKREAERQQKIHAALRAKYRAAQNLPWKPTQSGNITVEFDERRVVISKSKFDPESYRVAVLAKGQSKWRSIDQNFPSENAAKEFVSAEFLKRFKKENPKFLISE